MAEHMAPNFLAENWAIYIQGNRAVNWINSHLYRLTKKKSITYCLLHIRKKKEKLFLDTDYSIKKLYKKLVTLILKRINQPASMFRKISNAISLGNDLIKFDNWPCCIYLHYQSQYLLIEHWRMLISYQKMRGG